uniref:aldose epimerase family protein n=1 Tax=Clostridium sp. NkU-1 TaxID=1095009 RepID=UPI003260EC3D
MPDKREVYLYTLVNRNGVSASFTNLGAVWVNMNVPDRDGKMVDVVLGFDSADEYLLNPPHFGAPIGRNANRIAGAKFSINGKEYRLKAIMDLTIFTAARIFTRAVFGTVRQRKMIWEPVSAFPSFHRMETRDSQGMQTLP